MGELLAEIRGCQAGDGFRKVGGRDGEVCRKDEEWSLDSTSEREKRENQLTQSLFRNELDGLDEDLELRFQRIEDELLLVEPLRGSKRNPETRRQFLLLFSFRREPSREMNSPHPSRSTWVPKACW